MIILGAICLVFWLLGGVVPQDRQPVGRFLRAEWSRPSSPRIPRASNRAAATRTRSSSPSGSSTPSCCSAHPTTGRPGRPGPWTRRRRTQRAGLFENRELAFLRNVRLLYQDYLDGSPLHRSDTKASVQLLGNLALTNLRRSHLGHLLREGRTIDRLDLSRAGGLFGGPYLWFNYITRMLVQETALLLLDYNRHAIPLDRLACSPPVGTREVPDLAGGPAEDRPRRGLGARARRRPHWRSPGRPAAVQRARWRMPGSVMRAKSQRPPRKEAGAFLETVEFTAVDFLADDPERDCEIHARFGPQVAELVRRDRQQNVRRAFRSFPLHELPLTARTINPFAFYEAHLSGGRIVLLRLSCSRALGRAVAAGVRSILRVVHEILHPAGRPAAVRSG